jgi:hypothetical protein
MESCEPPAPKAFGVAAPKNRVGGSPVFSFVFAFQYIGQTLDTPAENGGCGYDFASGVHKYLYTEDDPIDGIDPFGNDTINDEFSDRVRVGLVGAVLTPHSKIEPDGSMTVDQITEGETITLSIGSVLIYTFNRYPAGNPGFDVADTVGADITAVPDLNGPSESPYYEWRQYYTDDDPSNINKHKLDVDWRNHQPGEWVPNYNPRGPEPSGNSYSFHDSPRLPVSPNIFYPPSAKDYVSKVTWSFETQLVSVPFKDVALPGTVILTIKWGFWYTVKANDVF